MLKLGLKAPSMHTAELKFHLYLDEAKLPPLLTATNWASAVTAAWGMYLNDSLGDCTCAGPAHNVVAITANAGNPIMPTDAEVQTMYEASGYLPSDASTDQGWTLKAAAQYMVSTGLAGVKAEGFVEIDPTNLTHVRYALQLLGPALNLGVNLPKSAMDVFENANGQNVVWSNIADTDILGGHDVAVIDFMDAGVRLATWGSDQVIATWEWFGTYVTEVSAMVFPAFIRQSGMTPSGLKLADLIADAQSLSEA